MQTPQLIPHLRRNPAGKEIYYKLLSLPLLPADKIINEFKTLQIHCILRKAMGKKGGTRGYIRVQHVD